MDFEKRYQNSKILFSLSLLLLVGFIAMWLQNVYQDKVEDFENKVSYLWIKAVKDVEGKDFSNLIITTITSDVDSFCLDSAMGLRTIIREKIIGPSKKMEFSANYSYNSTKNDEELKIVLDTDSNLLKKHSKALFFLDSTSDSEMIKHSFSNIATNIESDITKIMSEFTLDIKLVKSKLDSELVVANIPIEYSIISLSDTSSSQLYSNDKFYTNTATGAKFTLVINSYQSYAFKNMWLEFLLGLFLLGIISSAFYYILNNLKEQNKLVNIKNDLISNITHELRTPIFTVSAALEALESFNGLEDPTRTKEYLSISKNELNRLSILVEKVLKNSLFEQTEMPINKEVLHLNSLVQTIANSLKLQLEQQQAKLNIEADSHHIKLHADKIHITNVIYNLIDNALKYRSEDPPVINVNLSEQNNQVQISLSDNGIGIPEEYLGQIFNKFFRVPKGNEHNVKGYGLGLNYVSKIIKQHNGTISASSKEGKSTTFTILLPKITEA
jgi:signal transduction histidine kinase